MSAAGQVGGDIKADGFAHGQAARLVGQLFDGGSCSKLGVLDDILAGAKADSVN